MSDVRPSKTIGARGVCIQGRIPRVTCADRPPGIRELRPPPGTRHDRAHPRPAGLRNGSGQRPPRELGAPSARSPTGAIPDGRVVFWGGWGGWGGSMAIMELDRRMTIS